MLLPLSQQPYKNRVILLCNQVIFHQRYTWPQTVSRVKNLSPYMAGHHGGLGSWPPGHASTPHSFTQNRCWTQLYKPHNMKDERLVSKLEGTTNFSRHLKQFDCLARLTPTPTPWFYDRSTLLWPVAVCMHHCCTILALWYRPNSLWFCCLILFLTDFAFFYTEIFPFCFADVSFFLLFSVLFYHITCE